MSPIADKMLAGDGTATFCVEEKAASVRQALTSGNWKAPIRRPKQSWSDSLHLGLKIDLVLNRGRWRHGTRRRTSLLRSRQTLKKKEKKKGPVAFRSMNYIWS